MTITIPVHRALSTKLAPRSFNVVTRWGYNPWLARVNATSNNQNDASTSRPCLQSKSRYTIGTRSYATDTTARPVGRPKAHTGRTPAKRTTKTSTSSKPGPKTAAGKKAVGRKPKAKTTKAAAKPKTKKAVKKPVKKPAAKKKAPSKTALATQRRAKIKELKEKALLDAPKQLPQTAWSVQFSEAQSAARGSGQNIGTVTRNAAEQHRSLTPEQKEHYNHVANQNKAANETAYKKWLSSFTPEQIREANQARIQLTRQNKETQSKSKNVKKYAPIKDDRLVSHVRSSYTFFNKDRHASGDFAHMTVAEASKLVSREWKALDASERKKFEDQGAADQRRYAEEYTTVYGHPPPTRARTVKA